MSKLLTLGAAFSLVVAVSVPAVAGGCNYGKFAHGEKTMTTASSSHEIKTEEAMSTFDPKTIEADTAQEIKKPVDSE